MVKNFRKGIVEGLFYLCIVAFGVSCSIEDNPDVDMPVSFDINGTYKYLSIAAIDTSTFRDIVGDYKLRIPFCETTNSGTIIVGADIREKTASDQTRISIGIVRSTDGGTTFSDPQIIIPHTGESEWDRSMDGTILVDRVTGRIYVFAHRITSTDIWEKIHKMGDYPFDCVYVCSDDDGLSWSQPQSFRSVLDLDSSSLVSVFGGVGHGITLSDGTLILPIQCKMAYEEDSTTYNIQSGIAYSCDRGRTWKIENLVPCYSSECMVVEYDPGKLMVNCKSYIGRRRVFTTSDYGITWQPHVTDETMIEPRACQGSLHKISKWVFFLNPKNEKTRSNITLQISDDYLNWHPIVELYPESCYGYTCLCNDGQRLYAVSETMGR